MRSFINGISSVVFGLVRRVRTNVVRTLQLRVGILPIPRLRALAALRKPFEADEAKPYGFTSSHQWHCAATSPSGDMSQGMREGRSYLPARRIAYTGTA